MDQAVRSPGDRGLWSASVDPWAALHQRWVRWLSVPGQTGWARRLLHPKIGAGRFDRMLAQCAWHGRHHAVSGRGLRARMGW